MRIKGTASLLIAMSLTAIATQAQAAKIFGLTTGQALVVYDTDTDTIDSSNPVTGFVGTDTALVGIDTRVQNGALYGVGNGGGVYTIAPEVGVLTFVNNLSVALDGSNFGVDFNPAADRLRIISNNGQSLRHNVNAGGTTLVDLALTNGGLPARGVSGAGYTNNDLSASTGTVLFDISAASDMLLIQSPANNGTLANVGLLGVNATQPIGFEVVTTVENGVTTGASGVMSKISGSSTSLYDVNLFTGAATLSDTIANVQLMDIALPIAP